MVEAPPLSWATLQAALSGRGVSLLPGWSCDEEAFRSSLRAEIRGRRFAAVFVVGGESVRRWLPWARQTAPAARIIVVMDEERSLAAIRGPGAAARRRKAEETRRALTQADEVWCSDQKTLKLLRSLLRGGPAPVLGPTPPEKEWLRRGTPPQACARIEALALGQADERAIAASLSRVSPGRARVQRMDTHGEGSIAALNKALACVRAPLVWLCLDAFESPDEPLLRTLAEGLASRPYAGGAVPVPGALASGRAAAHFRAAWAISRKGDWHEADRLGHACCLLLRRDALRAAGALDDRAGDIRFLGRQMRELARCL